MSDFHKGTRRFDDVDADSVTADSATVNGTTDTNALEAKDASVTNPINAPAIKDVDTGVFVSNLSLSDTETANLSKEFNGALIGELVVVKRIAGTATARFSLEGGFGITVLTDPTGQFGTTQGANIINVYEGSDANGDNRGDYFVENTGNNSDVVLSAIFIGSLTTDTS